MTQAPRFWPIRTRRRSLPLLAPIRARPSARPSAPSSRKKLPSGGRWSRPRAPRSIEAAAGQPKPPCHATGDSPMTDATKDDRTLSAALAGHLRQAIIGGRFQPGARLRLDELRSEFGVSLSPLREALMSLSAERLVDVE